MIKRVTWCLALFCLCASQIKLAADESKDGYEETYIEVQTPYGVSDEELSVSMIGWGLALAIGIVISAITLGSNDNSQAN